MSSNTDKGNAKESFRNNFRNFQPVKLLPRSFRQDLLDCPPEALYSFTAYDSCLYFTGQAKEIPVGLVNFSAKSVPIEILDGSPARQEGITFYWHTCQQECALLDQHGPRLDCVLHSGSPRRLSRFIVRQQLAQAIGCLRWPRSLQLVVLQAAFLMSFFVAGILTFLFSDAFRDSQIISPAVQKAVQGSLSNRTDSGKRATSSIGLVPVLFVSAIGVSLAATVAPRTTTLTALR